MDSTSRSRSSSNRQKDVVMKSRSRSPMNVDTQNSKLKNSTKKINLSNIKEKSKCNNYKSSKSEGDWDSSKSNNDESSIWKHKELQNLWNQYFRDGKTESDFVKERPPFLLKKKTVYNIFKRLREKGAYIRKKGSGRKSNWDDLKKITLKKFLVKIVI